MNNYTMCMKSKLFVTITPSSQDKCTCTLLTLTPISEYMFTYYSEDIIRCLIYLFCKYLYFICFKCTWHRYKSFLHYQKKKERKEKPLAQGKVQY